MRNIIILKLQTFLLKSKSRVKPLPSHFIFPIKTGSRFGIASVLFLFFIYNLTISPTIYWRDAPEFVDTAYTFGIAHPAGFPAYSIISKLFTFLPFSNIAMRVNYVSLLFAVLTCWLTFHITIELINLCYKKISGYHASLAAVLGALFLGGATSFWWQATVTEVYTMNCFFLSAFFLFALKWHRLKDPRLLMLASFIYGFSAAVYGANLIFIPIFTVFYFLAGDSKSSSQIFLTIAFFLLGYSIYLYLPVRSLTNPPFDWGNPETLTNFIYHITDKKDETRLFGGLGNLSLIYSGFLQFITILNYELTPAGIVFGIIGSICHFNRDKKSFFLLALTELINTLFFITTLTSIAMNGSLFLVSFLIFAFWIGLGVYLTVLESKSYILNFKFQNIIIPLAIVFIIYSFAKDYIINNRTSYYLPRDHVTEMYSNAEQSSIIFTNNYYFQFRYLKDVESFRPDITNILISNIERPDLFAPVNKKRFPLVNFPAMELKVKNSDNFLQSLISENINKKPIYWDMNRKFTAANYKYLIPDNKFLMRVVGHKVDEIPGDLLDQYLSKIKISMRKEFNDEQFFTDQNMGVRSYYYVFLSNFADYLMKRKMYNNALPFLYLANTMAGINFDNIATLQGICYMNIGDYHKAEDIFTRLYEKDKNDYVNNFNLASVYFRKEDLKKAKFYLNRTIKLKKNFIKSYILLGSVYAEEGNYDQGIKYITYAIENTKNTDVKSKMRETLKEIKKLKEKNEIQ